VPGTTDLSSLGNCHHLGQDRTNSVQQGRHAAETQPVVKLLWTFVLITEVHGLFVFVCADVVLPEGVDPSFLAALPENIRQEVIMEQLRLQRIQQRAQQVQQEAQSLGVTEVNPEFLAALPPHIQEEVRCGNSLL